MAKVASVAVEMDDLGDETKQVEVAQGEEFDYEGPRLGCVIVDEGEQNSSNLWQSAAAEFLGMMFFLFFTIATVNSSSEYSNGQLDGGRVFMISSVFGFMIAILVYAIAPISGGNLNPAVSLALFVTRRISFYRFVVYVACQCVGAFVGCTLVSIVFKGHYINAINSIGSYTVTEGEMAGEIVKYTDGQALLGEIIGTALLVFCVMSAVDSNNAHPGRTNMKNSLGVFMIGMCVTMAHCVLIPITNCSINPARALATSLVSGDFTDHWVMWIGPFLGALFSAAVYEVVLKDRKTKSN